jgi:hypothetical protein
VEVEAVAQWEAVKAEEVCPRQQQPTQTVNCSTHLLTDKTQGCGRMWLNQTSARLVAGYGE